MTDLSIVQYKGASGFCISLLLSFLLFSHHSSSQHLFKNYTTADGLPDSRVAPIVQDRDGYLWFGTHAGLTRYDGREFKKFSQAKEIPGIFGRDVVQDHCGAIWFAYTGIHHGGLVRLWNGRIKEYSRSDGLSGDQAHCVIEDANHDVWVGTNGPLNRIHFMDSTRTSFVVDSFPGYYASALYLDSKRKLWIGGDGLFSYTDKKIKHESESMGHKESFPVRPYAIFETSSGELWAGGYAGAARIVNETLQIFSTADGLPERGVWSFCEDKLGNFWVGTTNGLYRLKHINGAIKFFKEQSFGDAIVYDICLDREGNVWFASAPGARKLIAADFVLDFPHKGLLATAGFGPMLEDSEGGIYFGSRNTGLYYLKGTRLRFGEDVLPFSSLTFTAMFSESATRTWFGIRGGGAFLKNGSKIIQYSLSNGLPSLNVNAFAKSADGLILIATAEGLAYAENDSTIQRLSHPDLDSLTIFDIKTSPDSQEIWLATTSGVRRIEVAGNIIHTVERFHEFSSQIVYEILIDKEGRVWFGTDGAGLIRFDGSSFKAFTRDDGLVGDRVFALAEDSLGHIWVGTSSGLSQFDGGTFRNFTHDQGFGEIGLHGLMVDRDGDLWVSSFPGVSKIKPARFYKSNLPPPIYISEVQVDALHFSPDRRIEVGPNHGVITFRYAGLSFTDEADVRYKYKLDGYDNDWSPPVKVREVRYTHLPAGDYTFIVQARSRDGVWSVGPASVSLTVLPPVWSRWWFILSGLAIVSLTVYGFYTYRLNKLLELERTRSRIATDLHDDIGSSLTRISVMTEVAQREAAIDLQAATDHLAKIGNTARDLIDALGDIVWSVDPTHDDLQSVIRRIVQFGEEICEGRGIAFETELSGGFEETKLSLEQRRDVFLVFKEAIHNIVKHSNAKLARFCVQPTHRGVLIALADNGVGFSADTQSTGHGLESMAARGKRAGVDFLVESESGKGTTVSLEIKTV